MLEETWPSGFLWWMGALFLTCLFHGLVFQYLGWGAIPAGKRGLTTFLRRTVRYFLASLLLEGGVIVLSIPALLLGLIASALLGFVGLPGPIGWVVAFGITLLPALIVSIGGVLFGCAAMVAGTGPWASIVTSFRLARIDWKLTGALVTFPYTLLLLVDWVPWSIGMFRAIRSQWSRLPGFSPSGISSGPIQAWMTEWSHWFDRVSRLAKLPVWYRFGVGPAVEGLAVLYTLATLWVLYEYFTGPSGMPAPRAPELPLSAAR